MGNKVIGIISYLPNDVNIKAKRKELLKNLIHKCNQLFNLPIIIIAQNWLPEDRLDGCLICNYNKPLGITGARRELRKKFLASNYSVLIMLDDDCILEGNSGYEYLKQIDENPGCYYVYYKSLLKLFAISKELFKEIDFDINVNPENGDGFEDRIFYNTLLKKYPDKQYQFKNIGIKQISKATADPLSTWYKNQNLKNMLDKTFDKINKM